MASRIATFIVKARREKPLTTTGQLVEVIKAAIPAKARREGPHPAKRTFQAIRIEVNDELGQLQRAMEEFCDVLRPGGRLCVISFHSLEDRIAKEGHEQTRRSLHLSQGISGLRVRQKADIQKITRKPICPQEKETENNPRARSAKLRVCEKI